MLANNNKFYLGNLDNLVDEGNNNYHCFIGKTSVYTDYPAFSKEIESNHKSPKFKLGDKFRYNKYKMVFRKGCTKSGQKRYDCYWFYVEC